MAVVLLALSVACPRPERPPPRVAGSSAEQTLAEMERVSRASVQAVGLVHIDYLASDGAFRGDADVAVARPGQLRIELRSFFGQPLLALAIGDGRFVYVDNSATAVVRGPTSAPRLRQLIPLALAPELTVPLLLGAVPDLGPGTASYVRSELANAVALDLVGADGRWRIDLDERSRIVIGVVRYDRSGQQQFAVRFADHAAIAGVPFPRRGEVQVAGRAGAVRWHWQQVEVNGAALDPELWSLAIPVGYSVEEAPPAP